MGKRLHKSDFNDEMKKAMGAVMRKAWAKHRHHKTQRHTVSFNPHRRKSSTRR